MALTRAQIQTAFQNSLGRAASQSDENSYFSVSQSGALTDAQIFSTISNSREADQIADPVIRFYQAAFGRVPDQAGLANAEAYVRAFSPTAATYQNLANMFAQSTEFTNRFGTGTAVDAAYVQALYSTILGRQATSGEVDGYVSGAAGYTTRGGVLYAISQSSEAINISNAAVNGFQLNAAQGQANYTGTLYTAQNGAANGPGNGQTFVLTTGVDSLTGTAAGDTFTAGDINGSAVFTVGDTIDGAGGTDTLNITTSGAFAGVPAGVSVTNVETVNLVSGSTVAINTASGFTGLTTLSTSSVAGATVTAAATTNVTVTEAALTAADGNVTVQGGNNVTVNASGTITDGDAGAEIVVGSITAPTGTVTITNKLTGAAAADQGDIAITGGTTVSVTESLANAVNTTNTQGTVTVTGTASTTSVSVTQDRAATAATTVVGKVNGAVVITDVNSASATAAGTIKTVSLNSFGTSTINSGALDTLNLSGTGTALTVTQGNLTTAAVTTQALNVNGLTTTGTVTLGAPITTLNLTSSTAASTLAGLTAAGVTTLNIAGDANVTLTADTLNALQSVVVTNTAGASLGTALAAGTSFTGGAGADSITLSNAFTKAITTGAGNDTVTYGGAAGTGGSVVAGDGTDTIVMTGAQAAGVSGDGTFNSKFSGFEVLSLTTDGGTNVINLAAINGVNQVTVVGQTDATINGFSSGGTLTITGASTSETIGVTNALLNNNDVFNINVSNSGAGVLAAGTVNVAGVETINIGMIDAGTGTTNTAATIDTLTLQATAAKSIFVTGNDGLTLTNTGNTAVTLFDASGIKANTANDTAANLAVTYTSVTTSGAVTIIGGDGNDTLTGATAGTNVNTITGGNGADTIQGGAGNDIINLAETTPARDTVVTVNYQTNGVDTINGFTVGTATTADAIKIVSGDTTAQSASFAASTNTTLTTGAGAFALTGANTATNGVVAINATLSSFGNLDASGVVDGTELLKALSSNNVAAASITASATDNDFYLVAYQNNKAYVYEVINDANTTVIASEIHLVGVATGVAAGTLVGNNFVA